MEPTQSYQPQIDGLRAFAVLAVLYEHFWAAGEIGRLGVRLFFVISGLLITSILIDARERLPTVGLGSTLKTFYARRALRIFPAYYAVLLTAFALGLGDVRQTLVWHAAYASNFLFALQQDWGWPTAHLWSLSIEEQFYLIWPLLALTAPPRALKWLLLLLVPGSVAFRAWYFQVAPPGPAIWVATPAAIDALGIGALLAVWLKAGASVSTKLIVLLLVPALILNFIFVSKVPSTSYIWGEFLRLLPMALLVLGAYRGFHGVVGAILENPVSTFLGRISYGIYLYHLFIWYIMFEFIELTGIGIDLSPRLRTFVVAGAATIGVATLSWRFLEQPMNKLKGRFPYKAADACPVSARG